MLTKPVSNPLAMVSTDTIVNGLEMRFIKRDNTFISQTKIG